MKIIIIGLVCFGFFLRGVNSQNPVKKPMARAYTGVIYTLQSGETLMTAEVEIRNAIGQLIPPTGALSTNQ